MRAGGHKASAIPRLWRIAVLSAAGAIGTASDAEAGLYYWSDFDPGYYRPAPTFPQQRQPMLRRHQAIKIQPRGSAKPQGPLIIAISIEKQNLKIYDANGFFAETPISTGMSGYPTPLGVFSVIQKHKLHHSNIYSGAPMPYMQRITWSGVALHEGALPGGPASHGCIRMSHDFAARLWPITKLGIRVQAITADMVRQLRLSSSDGVMITAVDQDSLAEDAGLMRGLHSPGQGRSQFRRRPRRLRRAGQVVVEAAPLQQLQGEER